MKLMKEMIEMKLTLEEGDRGGVVCWKNKYKLYASGPNFLYVRAYL
jgi:hypothetical protein